VFGHDNVSHNYETVTPARLFENAQETVTGAGGAQIWLASITGTSYKVQVMSPVGGGVRLA